MDNELKNFRLNITQLAAITDLHRQTVASKLANVQPALGSNPKLKLYSITDILRELLTSTISSELVDVEKMLPPIVKSGFSRSVKGSSFSGNRGADPGVRSHQRIFLHGQSNSSGAGNDRYRGDAICAVGDRV